MSGELYTDLSLFLGEVRELCRDVHKAFKEWGAKLISNDFMCMFNALFDCMGVRQWTVVLVRGLLLVIQRWNHCSTERLERNISMKFWSCWFKSKSSVSVPPVVPDHPHTEEYGYGVDDNELQTLTLRGISHLNGCALNKHSLVLDGNYDLDHWSAKIVKFNREIERVEEWARTLPKSPIQKHYLSWVDYFKNNLHDFLHELQYKEEFNQREEVKRTLKELKEKKQPQILTPPER